MIERRSGYKGKLSEQPPEVEQPPQTPEQQEEQIPQAQRPEAKPVIPPKKSKSETKQERQRAKQEEKEIQKRMELSFLNHVLKVKMLAVELSNALRTQWSNQDEWAAYSKLREQYIEEVDSLTEFSTHLDDNRRYYLMGIPFEDIPRMIKAAEAKNQPKPETENTSVPVQEVPENLPIEEKAPDVSSAPAPNETPQPGNSETTKESEPEYIGAYSGTLRGRDPRTGNKGVIVRADPDYAGGVVEWELVEYDGLTGNAILERPSPEGRGIDRIPMKQGFLYAINQDIAQAEKAKRDAGATAPDAADTAPSVPEPTSAEPPVPEPDNQPAPSAPEWQPGDNIAHGFGRKFKPIDILSLDEIEAAYRFSIQTGRNIEHWQKERDGYLARRKVSEVYRRLLDIKSQLPGLNDQLTLAQSAYDAIQEESRKRQEAGVVIEEPAVEQDYQKRTAEITSQYEDLKAQIEELKREKSRLERPIDPSLRDRLRNVYESAQTASGVWGDIKKRFKNLAAGSLWEYRKSEAVRKGLEDFELIADAWYRELADEEPSQKIIDRIDQIVERDAEAALVEAIQRHLPVNSEAVRIDPQDLEQFKEALRQELYDAPIRELHNDLFAYTDILRNNFKQSWWSRNVYGRMSPLLERLGF